MNGRPATKPYLVAFKATSMETRTRIVEWLRRNEAIRRLVELGLKAK